MNLTSFAIEKRTVTYFAVILLVVAGIASFFKLGQLEDPEFTVKSAAISTLYPGASPQEVEQEVTDRIELAIQQMPQIESVESLSRSGHSIIKVEMKQEYWSDRLPQVWDELRRKVRDIEATLPPGARKPVVMDDFGDVYGLLLAVTGDGFSYAELEQYVDELRKELSLVEGVAKVALWGVQDKAIFLDISQKQLSELGLTSETIVSTLSRQNMVVDAGSVNVAQERLRIAASGSFGSPEDIENVRLRVSPLELLGQAARGGEIDANDELVTVSDIATVRRGYLDPPRTLMRFNGEPGIALAISNISGTNVVELGQAVESRLEQLRGELPVGIEFHRIAWQPDLVSESIDSFMVNLLQAVVIVLVVLTLAMGWRMGMIIGSGLILTILGTFMVMAVWGIDLQRMSLGALVIALGMMVDNAIVVADGIAVRLESGMDRTKAAIESATQAAWPLLGATIVAVMAFYPIFASKANAGEYCRTLFIVVGVSLMISWLLAMTVTPLQCIDMLAAPKKDRPQKDPYGGRFYRLFRRLLETSIRRRFLSLILMCLLLGGSLAGFSGVKQMFFPDSSRQQFMVDYWAPEGTRIQQVSADLGPIEQRLGADARVKNLSTFVGAGPPRFYLPVEPEKNYQSYAQLIVNTQSLEDVNSLIAELEPWLKETMPQALIRVRKYGVGPSDAWPIELRFSGPAEADPVVLRSLADQGMAILEMSPLAKDVRTNWRQRVKTLVADYDQDRGRWSGISREDLAKGTKRAFDGLPVGLFRDGDDLTPILIRNVERERQNISALDVLQIQGALSTESVPLSQVTQSLELRWEDPIIWRYDRRRAISVQASPKGVTFPSFRASVIEELEGIELPPGYRMDWGGEFKSTQDARSSLVPGVVPAVVIMLFIIVALFNAFRPALIIVLTIPFALIGITWGLLWSNTAFGFMALLGAMSLSGMMIKNAIVLLDQINLELAGGKDLYQAVIDSALSRLRPVVLAAATTVLGVIPLMGDLFWVSMSVTIMAGLAFGTVLTMIMVPVLYAVLEQ